MKIVLKSSTLRSFPVDTEAIGDRQIAPVAFPLLHDFRNQMIPLIELLKDVVGTKMAGVERHPVKGIDGDKFGFFSYTFSSDNSTFQPVTEAELRRMIEAGEFNTRGRVRMVPANATTTGGARGLRVRSYKGRQLPL